MTDWWDPDPSGAGAIARFWSAVLVGMPALMLVGMWVKPHMTTFSIAALVIVQCLALPAVFRAVSKLERGRGQ